MASVAVNSLMFYTVLNHFRGTFGDYGIMEDLYHLEPLENISNEVRNKSIILVPVNN